MIKKLYCVKGKIFNNKEKDVFEIIADMPYSQFLLESTRLKMIKLDCVKGNILNYQQTECMKPVRDIMPIVFSETRLKLRIFSHCRRVQ